MNAILANYCQDLLFIYIDNKIVGGTPLHSYGTMVDKKCLYFVGFCDGINTVFYSSCFPYHGLKFYGDMYWLDD
jgi:hypothetical protein